MSQSPTLGKPRKPLAFFDIDGTLTEGFTIFSFAEFLHREGLFHPTGLSQMQQDKEIYRQSRRSEQDYHQFAVRLVDHYAQGLRDQPVEQVRAASPSFLEHALRNELDDYRIHGFAAALVQMMSPIAATIAISGSPQESLLSLNAHLGFQELNSTLMEINRDRYTGQVKLNLAISESKRQLVRSYLAGGINREASFAFGDSVQDTPMLEAVGNAFVLGGNPELETIGSQRGWYVISMQDDVVGAVKDRIASLFGA